MGNKKDLCRHRAAHRSIAQVVSLRFMTEERSCLTRTTPSWHHSRVDSIRNPPADREQAPVSTSSARDVSLGVWGIRLFRSQIDQKLGPLPHYWLNTPKPRHSSIGVLRIWLSNNLGFGNLKMAGITVSAFLGPPFWKCPLKLGFWEV